MTGGHGLGLEKHKDKVKTKQIQNKYKINTKQIQPTVVERRFKR